MNGTMVGTRPRRAQLIAEVVAVVCPDCGATQPCPTGSEMWTPIEVKPSEWRSFILKLRVDEADWSYEAGEGWSGHNDRLVAEWFEKASDKHPVERLYFGLDDGDDGVAELIDQIKWEQEQA